MDGLVKRATRAIFETEASQKYDSNWLDEFEPHARAVLEEIKPAVISMFRVMAQPGFPALTPEQRWDAMVEDRQEEEL